MQEVAQTEEAKPAEEPVAETKAEEPAAEASKAEEPVATEEPKAEEPVAEKPAESQVLIIRCSKSLIFLLRLNQLKNKPPLLKNQKLKNLPQPKLKKSK